MKVKEKRWFGVDLHRNRFTVCSISEGKKKKELKTWELGELGRFVAGLSPRDEVAVECTGNARLFAKALAKSGCRLVLVNASQFKLIAKSVKKTDAIDAETLALFLSKDMLPEARMKDDQSAKVSSLAETRDKLVKARTVLKNKVNNILSAHGFEVKRESLGSDSSLDTVLKMNLNGVFRVELEVIVEQIRSLNRSIEKLDEALGGEGSKLEGFENLKSIKGVGPKGAAILLSVIGKIADFESHGKLAAYLGIVPRVRQSNETETHGRITKRGSKLGRTTLVQCALIAKRYSPYLDSFHARVKAARGGAKANIALARKFLGIVYKTLKYGWLFEDFPSFKMAKTPQAATTF